MNLFVFMLDYDSSNSIETPTAQGAFDVKLHLCACAATGYPLSNAYMLTLVISPNVFLCLHEDEVGSLMMPHI